MRQALNIGMIGLDTSHALVFTELLNTNDHPFHVNGGRVVAAYPGGSDDFELSRSRVAGYTATLREKFGVEMMVSPEAVAQRCDAILLTSVDGRAHRGLFEKIARYRRPTFIDKPFAVSSADAEGIVARARDDGVPVMGASSLRFAEGLSTALADDTRGGVIGADFFGPMELQPTQPGVFWYGVHAVEMLYATLGRSCRQVRAVTNDDHDLIVGVWADGRIGTVRGNRKGNSTFGGVLHRQKGSQLVDTSREPGQSRYGRLLERVLEFFTTGVAAVDVNETLETIRFMEAANASRATGKAVPLQGSARS